MSDFSDKEATTGSICVACAGEGKTVKETATGYRAMACGWCDGTGVMNAEQLAKWKMRSKVRAQ